MPVQSLIMMVSLFAIMYFLMIRPQKKKMEEANKMRSEMKIGDRIVTVGGIRGKVTSITDDSFEIETGSDFQRIEFLKHALSYIVTPVSGHEEIVIEEEVDNESTIEFVDDEEDTEERY